MAVGQFYTLFSDRVDRLEFSACPIEYRILLRFNIYTPILNGT
jgi:hypothetical protein